MHVPFFLQMQDVWCMKVVQTAEIQTEILREIPTAYTSSNFMRLIMPNK